MEPRPCAPLPSFAPDSTYRRDLLACIVILSVIACRPMNTIFKESLVRLDELS